MTKENKNTSFRRYFLNTGIQWYFYHQFAFRWHQLLFAKVALLSDAEYFFNAYFVLCNPLIHNIL